MMEWAHKRGILLFSYLYDWLVIAGLIPRLIEHGRLFSYPCQGLGIVINWEKLDVGPTHRGQYLSMLMVIIRERVYLTGFRIVRFHDVVDEFLQSRSPPVKMWQQVLGHLAFLVCFVPRGRAWLCPLQWQLKSSLSALADDPALLLHSAEKCHLCVR